MLGFDPMAKIIEMLNQQLPGTIGSFENPASYLDFTVNDVTTQVTDQVGSATGMAQDGLSTLNQSVSGVQLPQFTTSINGANTALGNIQSGGQVFDRMLNARGLTADQMLRPQLRSIDFQLDDLHGGEAEFKIKATLQEIKTRETVESGQSYALQNAGQTLLSALFEQAESPISGDLLNIELRVKGDPYWLEPNPHYINTAPTSAFRRLLANRGLEPNAQGGVASISTNGNEQDDIPVANTSAQQTLMVFRSFSPQEFDSETGLTPPPDASVNALTGVYAVKEVTHSFAGGEFTQTLHGIRDVNINIRDINLGSDVSGNTGGEYGLTISEFDFSNLAPTTLTAGDGGSLVAVVSNVSGDNTPTLGGLSDFFSGAGLDIDSNTSGTVSIDINSITLWHIGWHRQ